MEQQPVQTASLSVARGGTTAANGVVVRVVRRRAPISPKPQDTLSGHHSSQGSYVDAWSVADLSDHRTVQAVERLA